MKKALLMLSLLCSSIMIFLSSDLFNNEVIYNELDSLSIQVGYYISKNGGINDTIKSYVKKEANATLSCDEECIKPKVGDTYFYILSKEYNPIILRNKNIVKIKRSVVISL